MVGQISEGPTGPMTCVSMRRAGNFVWQELAPAEGPLTKGQAWRCEKNAAERTAQQEAARRYELLSTIARTAYDEFSAVAAEGTSEEDMITAAEAVDAAWRRMYGG